MKRTRAVFKLALRYCRNHVEELKADACAESLFDKDPHKFWKSVYKMSNSKVACHVNSIGGATGPQNVVDMWKNHFHELYSSSDVNRYRNIFQDKITASSKCTGNIPKLTIYDIVDAVHKQKRGKAAGPDGIHGSVHLWWSAA